MAGRSVVGDSSGSGAPSVTQRSAIRATLPTDILFSNAASCIRSSAWRAEPFTLPAAEDVEWAERVVAAGWKVVYEARGLRVPLTR